MKAFEVIVRCLHADDDNKKTYRLTNIDKTVERSEFWQLAWRVTTVPKDRRGQNAAEAKRAIEITKEVAAQKISEPCNKMVEAKALRLTRPHGNGARNT